MKLGIYGGAFNPIHYGHLRTAQEVIDMLALDKVLFVPSGRTPFDKPDLEQAGHRYEMVRRAIRGNRQFAVSDMEIKRRGRSYTIDTIRKLRNIGRKTELFFILGIDAFLDLPHWKEPDALVDMTNIVVISRPDSAFHDLSSSPYLAGVPAKILRDLDRGRRTHFSFAISGKQAGHLCKVTALNISATRIRGMIISGEKIKYLLPDSVNSYIISNKLYKDAKMERGETFNSYHNKKSI